MDKKDLTQYSDQELSMLVQNDEVLYNTYMRCVRKNNIEELKNLVDDVYLYTKEQWEDLESDFESEVEEYNKENEDDE